MNLTPEQEALVLSKLGYKPYEAKLVVGPDGVDIVETPTEDRGWKDSAALIGTRIPRELAAIAGGLWGAARAEPAALKMARLGAKIPGPAPLKGAGALVGHMAVSAPAFVAGNATARGIYDASSVSKMVDDALFPSTAQKLRAETEHPLSAHGADLASNLLMFQFNNPLKVGGALAKLLRPGMLARGEMGAITEAERELLRNTGRNAAAGVIMAAGSDAVQGEKPALERIAQGMVEGAMFGLPRGLARKALAPFTTAEEAAQKSKGLLERFPPVLQKASALTLEGFVPDLMKPAAPSIMGEQPPVIKPAPDIMGTRPDLMVQPEFQPFARQAEPHDYPPFNPDDPIGLNVARASGTLAQQMAAARERGPMGRSTAELYSQPALPPGFAGPSTAEHHAFGPQTPELYNQPEVPPGFARTSSGEQAPYGPPNKRQLQYFLENLDLTPKLSKPPVRETTATDYNPEFPAPGRTEAEILQDQLEGNNVRYQAAKKDSASPLDAEREALRRRGLSFEETDDTIHMPGGGVASGDFDRTTGKIRVSVPYARSDTHVHEGMHAEINDMLNSDNPKIKKAGQRLLNALGNLEEPLVEGATATSRGSRGQNELVRAVKDAWNYFRTTKLGGSDMTPERAARLLAERFDYGRPSEFKGGGTGVAHQPFVPGSVVGKAGKENPVVGRAMLDMATARDQLHGMVNSELEALSQLPRDVVNSMAWKRSRAGQFKTKPEFTPEEQRANDIYQRVMDITAREATKHGYPIEQMANYVPEMAGVDQARAYEDAPKITELLTKFHDLNSKIHGNFYDPVKGEEYLRQYLSGVRRAPNSMGSDFGALTKDARQYHLPDEFREYDQLRNLQRYVNRWSTGVAKKAHILNNPAVADALGYNGKIKHESGAMAEPELSGAMQNAKMFIEDTLFNQGRGTSGIGQNVRDVIMGGQQVVNAATMQTLSDLKNTLAKVPMQLISTQNLDQAAAVMRGALEPVLNYNLARERAMKMNVIRPNVDPAFDTSAPLGTRVARKLSELGTMLRKYTASQFLEEFNRAQDFAIGKQLAETNIKLAESGDKDALRFLDQFDYGKGGDRTDNIARNYAKAIQGTYSGEGLPAAMVKGGAVGTIMRIQRYGIENFNRTRQMVIEPARNGEYGPLLTYTLGLALTAPAIIKLQELFSGRPSGLPTDEEIKAGKNTELVEKTLNLMTMAQIAGAFGYAGNVAGAVAQNARGNPQALVGDPSVSFTADLLKNLAMAAGAVHNGEPVVPVLEEVFKRSVIDHMQLLRGLTTDRELAKDTRNKRVFEQQSGTRDVNGAQIATGLMFGDLGSDRTPKISPTFEAAKKGDPEAIAKLSPREQALLDNYKGGYEDEDREYAYQAYLLKSQGPEALKAYIQRRVDAIHQRAPR